MNMVSLDLKRNKAMLHFHLQWNFDIKEHAKAVKVVVKSLFMKCYGKKWKGSELRMHTTIIPSRKASDTTTYILNNRTTSMNVLGFHEKRPVTYFRNS